MRDSPACRKRAGGVGSTSQNRWKLARCDGDAILMRSPERKFGRGLGGSGDRREAWEPFIRMERRPIRCLDSGGFPGLGSEKLQDLESQMLWADVTL